LTDCIEAKQAMDIIEINIINKMIPLTVIPLSRFHCIGYIDAHKLKIQWRRYLKFLPKSLRGQGFQEKLLWGSPYFRFYSILLTNVLKFA